ncbi:MAG: Rieske 2Fe-2S domain-containing protein [Actinomycetota bacterium]|nr:Rieske 2Fe-2S domain-containing protein [Actinomycetota bacterium]
MDVIDGVDAGSVEELLSRGMLLIKVGSHGVCVLWHSGKAYAVDDRCPHLGFPLHRGTVEDGLLTCHWHHARFDLCSGGTLDPFADDVRAYTVEIHGGRVVVLNPPATDPTPALLARLDEGLEQGFSLVMAKSVLGLLDAGAEPVEAVRRGVAFGTTHRREGWGSGLTVLVAMANLLPQLDPADRPLAVVQGLAFLSRDTRGHADRFPLAPLAPLATNTVTLDRLAGWYRRFIDTRTDDAAERALITAIARGEDERAATERFMMAAATDHLFLDGGHTLDFTNKAFEALDLLGWGAAGAVLPTLVSGTASAGRSEEQGSWRHPHNLAGLARSAAERLAADADVFLKGPGVPDEEVVALAWRLVGSPAADDPADAVEGLLDGLVGGFTPEQAGRAVALAAGLRITRFHLQNDHGDWDVVHHGFTYANAVHQALTRYPSAELLRGAVHGALKVFLDRFLNVPAARLVPVAQAELGDLQGCWDSQGQVDRAGGIVYAWLREHGDPAPVIAALGHALIAEDAAFHWFQTVEAAARQAQAWPDGSEPQAQLLAGAARFLAAHTPTRRELPKLVRIATRLRRGDDLFEES